MFQDVLESEIVGSSMKVEQGWGEVACGHFHLNVCLGGRSMGQGTQYARNDGTWHKRGGQSLRLEGGMGSSGDK